MHQDKNDVIWYKLFHAILDSAYSDNRMMY